MFLFMLCYLVSTLFMSGFPNHHSFLKTSMAKPSCSALPSTDLLKLIAASKAMNSLPDATAPAPQSVDAYIRLMCAVDSQRSKLKATKTRQPPNKPAVWTCTKNFGLGAHTAHI